MCPGGVLQPRLDADGLRNVWPNRLQKVSSTRSDFQEPHIGSEMRAHASDDFARRFHLSSVRILWLDIPVVLRPVRIGIILRQLVFARNRRQRNQPATTATVDVRFGVIPDTTL